MGKGLSPEAPGAPAAMLSPTPLRGRHVAVATVEMHPLLPLGKRGVHGIARGLADTDTDTTSRANV